MIYAFVAGIVYVALGIVLTQALPRRAQSLRVRASDLVVGAVSMPVISLVSLLCGIINAVWTGLLILLDFDPDDRPPSRTEDGTPA